MRTCVFYDVLHFIPKTKHNNFPVVKEDNTLVGVLLFEEIREFVFEEGLEDIVVAGEVCEKGVPTILPPQIHSLMRSRASGLRM